MPSLVEPERIRILRDGPSRSGRYVLYWMQSSQRTEENPALRYATERADRAGLPLVAYFGLDGTYPESTLRHLQFMAEGLSDVARSLEDLGILFALRMESPQEGACRLARDASVMVVDRGYLRPQQAMYRYAAEHCRCPLVQVEGNVVVPVETASQKEEYSAATLRPKTDRLLDRFLHGTGTAAPRHTSLSLDLPPLAGEPAGSILSHVAMDRSVPASPLFQGGSAEAERRFTDFLDHRLDGFAETRNDPGGNGGSGMSPYLHFGQVSPVTLALRAREHGGPGVTAFLEELSAASEQLAEVADSIPGVVYQFFARDDGARGVRYVSRRAADIFGYSGTAGDFFAWFMDHVDERDREAFLRSIDTAVATASPWNFEGRFVTPGGKAIWFQGTSQPARRGNELIFNGVLLDITGRKVAEEALRESEERLRAFIDSTLDSVVIIDPDGIVTEWNSSCARISGIAREDALGRRIRDIFANLVPPEQRTPGYRSLLEQKIRTSLQTGTPATPHPVEAAIIRPDGTRAIIRQVTFPIKADNGFWFGLIAQDITREKQAGDALRESEERFRTLVETSPDMLWEIDNRGTIQYISPRVRDILGYEPSELIGGPVTLLVAEHARPFVTGEIAKHAAAQSGLFTIEVPAKHKDGRDLVIEIRSAPVPDAQGAVTGLRGTAHDITARRKALAALAKSRELFRKLVATVPDIVVCTDLEGRITYANEKVLDLGGYTDLQEITGTPVFRYFAPEDLPRAMENTRLMFERQLGPVGYTFITRDGSRHLIEINGDVLRNPDGTPCGMVYVGRDVTQRKKTDDEIRRTRRQLSLLSSVTRHDILNKVSIQLGLLALARMKVRDSPEMASFIQKLESAATAIRDQIQFTQVYQDLGSHEPRWQDLHETLAKVPVPAHLAVSDECDGIMIYADVMLEQVFAILIDNALRHGVKVTGILMTAEEADGTLVIRFGDNGSGIPDDEKEKIFERGYGKNTGLGLFLAREILSLTGITIRETGTPGSGARFEITVPKGAYRFSP